MLNMLPIKLQIPLVNGQSLKMRLIPGGEFVMGSDENNVAKPLHRVQISSFYLGEYPVTQAQYQAVTGENPSMFKGDVRPVEMVSWLQAKDFSQKLAEMTSMTFRLPTEAEWEFAARGGTNGKSFLYSGSDQIDEVGWYYDNSYEETKPAGLKLSNELGLHDMSGNVWEWCHDWFSTEYYKQCKMAGCVENPQGPKNGSHHVIRGGSFSQAAGGGYSFSRLCNSPDRCSRYIGFRLALSIKQGETPLCVYDSNLG